MRKLALAALIGGALTHPVHADSVWERLDRGVDIVRECTGDIVQYCKGVTPGAGRIKACMLNHLKDM